MRLHGREAEQQVIDGLLAGARAGRSGAVVVRGEAGIGKTALLDYAADVADGMLVLRAAGVETEAELAFGGLHLLLRPVLDRIEGLPGPQARSLRGALGLSEGGSQDRFLSGLAVLSLMSDLAEDQPLLCLIDDAHWLDAASADALTFTARRLEAEGVVIVLAARDGPLPFAAPGLPDLPLHPLDSDQAWRLLEERAQHLAPALKGRVLAEADGNPLALVELAAAMTANSAAAGPGPLPLTNSVQELIAAQIRRLGVPTALLLLLAAAESSGDLAQVLPAVGAIGAGADALAAAERAGLVAVDEGRVVFRHPLVRAAAYHGAPLASRQAAHRALADVLDGQPDPDGRRAWHRAAAASGRDEQVAAELVRTAERYRTRGGYAAVSAAYERAAQLTPDSGTRARRLLAAATAAADAGHADRADRLTGAVQQLAEDALLLAEIALLQMARMTGDHTERIAELAAAVLPIASRYPERAAAMLTQALRSAMSVERELTSQLLAHIDDLPLPPHARLQPLDEATVQRARFLVGDPAAELGPVREAVAAIRQDPQSAEPDGRVAASAMAFFLGDADATREISAALAAECRRLGTPAWLPGALQGLTMTLIMSGDWAVARASATEGLKLAHDMGALPRAAFLANLLGLLAAHTGDDDDCEAWMAECLRLGGSTPFNTNSRSSSLALLDLGNGRFGAALDRLAKLRGDGWGDNSFMWLPDLVEAAARTGNVDHANQALARFEAWRSLTGQPWTRAVTHRCQALVSDDAHAEQHYRAAVGGDYQGRPFEEARSRLVYGEWLRRHRRRGEARAQLADAHETFDDLGAAGWAQRAARELAAVGAAPVAPTDRPARPAGALAQLTPQELQVVQLAAGGLSNRDIAAQMFLSPRTVGYHLYKAYPKLGISSRVELARLLTTQQAQRTGHASRGPLADHSGTQPGGSCLGTIREDLAVYRFAFGG
jgi:DNA-binding CsgD family transcriptional regulator/tetratricopeptide (TPR) repeat protein